jgi:hypothetical protein
VLDREIPDQFRLSTPLSSSLRQPWRLCVSATIISLVLAGVGWIWLQPVIPLLYTVADPNQQLVSKWWIGVFPALSFLFTTSHFLAFRWLKDWTSILMVLTAWSCVVLQFILLSIEIRLLWIVW